jgi:hypothetical protein
MSVALLGSTCSGVSKGFRLTVQEVIREELDLWDAKPTAGGGRFVGFMCT